MPTKERTNDQIIDVWVVNEVTGADFNGTGDIIGVCTSQEDADLIKQQHTFAKISERKAVVDEVRDSGNGKDPYTAMLLDPDTADQGFKLDVDLALESQELRESALAKLTEDEKEALGL